MLILIIILAVAVLITEDIMSKGRGTKRVAFISDLHCGHKTGLCPPEFRGRPSKYAPTPVKTLWKLQDQMWKWYLEQLEEFRPHHVHMNGDLIDGRGERSGSTELWSADRNQQVDAAAACIAATKAKTCTITYGTPYHTGNIEDFEDNIANHKQLGATCVEIGGHVWPKINGLVFDCKHKVGASGIPHGEFTPLAKERLWNVLWQEADGAPKADVFIRSHVHYHAHCGETDWLSMTTPAMQGPGSKFGVRQCSRVVNIGFVCFTVSPSGGYTWQVRELKIGDTAGKPSPIEL